MDPPAARRTLATPITDALAATLFTTARRWFTPVG